MPGHSFERYYGESPMATDLVCIIGPDGAGKTTQIRILEETLEDQNIGVRYMWLGFRHVLSLPILGIARAVGLSETEEAPDGTAVGYHYFWRSRVLSTIYPLVLYLDTLLFIVPLVYFYTYFTDTVVLCDRFVYDTLVDVMVSVGEYDLHTSRLGRMFLTLIPEETETVLLLAEPEVLRTRRVDVEVDNTIDTKVELYTRLADTYDITVVDASQPIDTIADEIDDAVDVDR